MHDSDKTYQPNKPLVQVFFDTGIGMERVHDMSTGPTQTTPPIVPKALNFAWGEHCCVYYVLLCDLQWE